jgi:hypothetical protein
MNDNPTDRPAFLTAMTTLLEEVKLTNMALEDITKLLKQLLEKTTTIQVMPNKPLTNIEKYNQQRTKTVKSAPTPRIPSTKSQILSHLITKYPVWLSAKEITKNLKIPNRNVHPRLWELVNSDSIETMEVNSGKIYRLRK